MRYRTAGSLELTTPPASGSRSEVSAGEFHSPEDGIKGINRTATNVRRLAAPSSQLNISPHPEHGFGRYSFEYESLPAGVVFDLLNLNHMIHPHRRMAAAADISRRADDKEIHRSGAPGANAQAFMSRRIDDTLRQFGPNTSVAVGCCVASRCLPAICCRYSRS